MTLSSEPSYRTWILTSPDGQHRYRMREYNQEITGVDEELHAIDPGLFCYGGSAYYIITQWAPRNGWGVEELPQEASWGTPAKPAEASWGIPVKPAEAVCGVHVGPPDLFKIGVYKLHSGATSAWKIDCDALTDDSISALAYLASTMLRPFKLAIGVPRGGMRLAAAMQSYASNSDDLGCLIVDDVLTTGKSMEQMRDRHPLVRGAPAQGLVIFARGPAPPWVRALFTCNAGGHA